MSWYKKNQGDLLVFSPKSDLGDIIEDRFVPSEEDDDDIVEKEDVDIVFDGFQQDSSTGSCGKENEVPNTKFSMKATVSNEKIDEYWNKQISGISKLLDEFITHCEVSNDKHQIEILKLMLQEKTKKIQSLIPNNSTSKKSQRKTSSPNTTPRKRRRKKNLHSIQKTPPTSPHKFSKYRKSKTTSTPSPKKTKRKKYLEAPEDQSIRRHSSPNVSSNTSPQKSPRRSKNKAISPNKNRRSNISPDRRNVRITGRVLSFDGLPSTSTSLGGKDIITNGGYSLLPPLSKTNSPLALHKKLSSPDRRIIMTSEEKKRKLRDRQENANRRRIQMNKKKKEQYRKSNEKIQKVILRKERIREAKIKVTEQRHKKAEKKKQEIIEKKIESAREETEKVREVKFVVSMMDEIEQTEKRDRLEKKHQQGLKRKQEGIKKKIEAAKKLNEKESRVKANRERIEAEMEEKKKILEKRSERSEKRLMEHKKKEMRKRKKKIEEHIWKVKKTKETKMREQKDAKERIMKKIREVTERKKESIESIKKRAGRASEKVRQARNRTGTSTRSTEKNSSSVHPSSSSSSSRRRKSSGENLLRNDNDDFFTPKIQKQQKGKSKKANSRRNSNENETNQNYRVPTRMFEERLRKSKEELFRFKKKYFSKNTNTSNTNSTSSSSITPTKISNSEIKKLEKRLRGIVQHMNSLLSTKKAVPNSMVSNVTRNLRKFVNYDTRFLVEKKKVFGNFVRFYAELETSRSKTTMIQFFLYLVQECKISSFLMQSLLITKFFEMTSKALDVGDIHDAVLLICILINCLNDEFQALKTDNDIQIRFAGIVSRVVSSYGLLHQVVQLIRDYACSGGWPGGRPNNEGWTGLDITTHIPDYIHNAFYFIGEVVREQFYHVLDKPVWVTRFKKEEKEEEEVKTSKISRRKSIGFDEYENAFVVKVFQAVVCPELTQFLATLILARGPIKKGGASNWEDQNNLAKVDMSPSLVDLTYIILESLNHNARYDVKFVQKFLWNSFEFRHLVHTLLAYTTTFCEERPNDAVQFTPLKNNIFGILNQVILLLGYFGCLNNENQNLLHLRSSDITIIKQLCNLPLQYFSDDDVFLHIVIPTLICCVFGNRTNRKIMEEELDMQILIDYINSYQEYSRNVSFMPPFLRKNPEYRLSNRFPMNRIEEVKKYLAGNEDEE